MGQVEIAVVQEKDNDIRLDRWFSRHYPDLKHGMLERLLKNKNIRVNKVRATANQHVVTGDEIRIPPLDIAPKKDVPVSLKKSDIELMQNMVLYKDNAMIILNKPAGLAVQGGSKTVHHIDGMLDALRFGKDEKPHLVHRLDKETSGVLVVARTTVAASKLTAAFKGRDVHKVYWAVVKGVPKMARGKIDASLTKKNDRVVVDMDGGDRAISVYNTVDALGKTAAWLELSPLTGRTHQLRVHLSDVLHTPILGDDKYGKATLDGSGQGLQLHARAIEIISPDTHKKVTAVAPLPAHMRETFDFLGFNEKENTCPFNFLIRR
ncbi:MAG: RluA family pseudouridine synthase [Alphaproteobacteria bacterium]|nr:RluA family pseudouridine synthase [Alphaproteobacteria bacterium]